MKDHIRIIEVGPRDGLQNEKLPIPIELKLQFVEKLFATGLQEVELTSFVRSDKIPQLSDAKELTQEISKKGLLDKCWVLVPNRKGAEIALGLGVKKIAFFTSASEEFNQKNINCSMAESIMRIQEAITSIKAPNIKLRGYLSMVFGCPYEGFVPYEKSLNVSEKLLSLGIHEISLGDTIGVAGPNEVQKLIQLFKKSLSLENLAMHFHDTKGTALVNIFESLKHGIKIFDSSAGGLGGCPYAKGATGNVATEDVINLLNLLQLKSGIDIKKLVAASNEILIHLKKTSLSKVNQYIQKELENEK